jgi:hypothetical protein
MTRTIQSVLILWAASPLFAVCLAADEPPAKKPESAKFKVDAGKKEDAKPEAAASEAAPSNVAGNWVLRIQSPRGVQEPILKLEKAGETYVGALTDPRGQATTVKEVKYKDGDLSFKIIGERQGQKFELLYTAKVSGEKLKGKMTVVGRNFNIPINGRRESPAEGIWKIGFILESGQKLQPTIQVKQVGEKLTGEYVGITGQKAHIDEVKFRNGDLVFSAPDKGDEPLVFNFAGKVTGDKCKGTVAWRAGGNETKSLKFEADKVRTLAADVAGVWKLTVATKNGPTFEPTLTITSQNNSAITGTYTGENGDTPITDGLVLGDELSFEVVRQKDGKSYKLRYSAKVVKDTIKGSVDYNFDGMTGFFDFEGKRVATATPAKP